MSATEQQQQQSATEQRMRAIWRELFEERDFGRASEWWSERTVDHFLALGVSATGAAELEAFFRELFEAVPDATMPIEQVTADDPARRAVVQWHLTGTTSGKPFQGIEPPPGRRIDLRGCDVFTLDEQGRVLENTIYYDAAEFARQIGMLPPRDSAVDRGITAAFNASTRLRAKLRS